jgi:transcription initiation factor TFIIB
MSCNEINDIWSIYDDVSDTFSEESEELIENYNSTNLKNNNDKNTSNKNNTTDQNLDEDKCRQCDKITDFKIEDGYKWCSECGENNGIFIDTTPEWRYYGSEDSKSSDPTRCGMPVNNLLCNMSCGTMISSKGNSPEVKRLRTIHKYITSNYNDRAILSIFENLNIIASNNNINVMIVEQAKKIYKDIRDVKISRGVNRDALIATCLMASLNINNVSRSQKEIAEIFNLNQSNITQGRKKLLELNNYIKNKLIYSINITTPINFIPRFCSTLNIESKYIELMKLIAKKVQKLPDISENTPPAIASGIIYLVVYLCELNVSKKNISNTCKISEVTINKCFKKLENKQEELIPAKILEKYTLKS